VPSGQSWHSEEASAEVVPRGQTWQEEDPCPAEYVPAEQSWHSEEASALWVPGWQTLQKGAAAAEKKPAEQRVHPDAAASE
jgi:hypothetical protein